jgi:hypothetical protein
VFKPPLGLEFKFWGNQGVHLPKLVSAMQARHLISKGCTGFLACVTKEKQELKIEELPGLPPNWKIEFSIDLLLGKAPISRAPYQMHLQNFVN